MQTNLTNNLTNNTENTNSANIGAFDHMGCGSSLLSKQIRL